MIFGLPIPKSWHTSAGPIVITLPSRRVRGELQFTCRPPGSGICAVVTLVLNAAADVFLLWSSAFVLLLHSKSSTAANRAACLACGNCCCCCIFTNSSKCCSRYAALLRRQYSNPGRTIEYKTRPCSVEGLLTTCCCSAAPGVSLAAACSL